MAAITPEENGNLLRYRVGRLEQAIEDLKKNEIGDLKKSLNAIQSRLTTLLITITASAITFALTILTSTGKL